MVSKKEQKSRNTALIIIGVMIVIWTVLGVMSFTDREGYDRPLTKNITFADQTALKGKQVFQAYNCMDCHTIVGNGAYFAPDLTEIYTKSGPAWLAAYLASPGTYPSEAIVKIQMQSMVEEGLSDIDNLDDYYAAYSHAETRIVDRGGVDALMPNLQFTKDEINALIAFFKYTGKLNTAGWPPEVRASKTVIESKKQELYKKSGLVAKHTSSASTNEESNSLSGEKIADDLGCIACHSLDGEKRIGPSWKNLYNSTVTLETGEKIEANGDYIRRSILQPNVEIVEGYPARVMPAYEGNISDEDLDAIVEFIKTLN